MERRKRCSPNRHYFKRSVIQNYWKLCTFVLLIAFLSVGCAKHESPPNVLIILADDLGYSDLGCYGGEIETPSLDRLASNGLRFTQFNNCARCWPTRAAILTGYYPQQIGRDNAPGIKGGGGSRNTRPNWAHVLPKYLRSKNYRSYHSGKWHLDGMPVESGFDQSYRLDDGSRFFSPLTHFENDRKLPPVERGTGYYSTINITDIAIEQLQEHEVKHKEQPFFSYVAFLSPHFPLHALPEDIEAIGDRYAPGWEELRAERWGRMQEMGIINGELSEVEIEIGPPYHFPKAFEILGDGEVNRPVPWNSLTAEQQQFQVTKMSIHAAMVERIDKEVGRIIEQLEAMNELDNTIIMFLSDNGASAEIMVRGDGHDQNAEPGSADSYLCLGPGWSNMCNTPFRRHKTWVHEGGSCTPFIVHWPDGIRSKGEIRQTHGHAVDIAPTIFDLTGIQPDSLKVSLPGQSLKPIFEKDIAHEHPSWYYHEGNRAIRIGDWKLVAAKDDPWELFNLTEDRTESKDLSGKYPDKVAEMDAKWNSMLEEMGKVAPRAE